MQLTDQSAETTGKILDHGAGLGEANGEQVEERARELAMIAGLSADEVNDGHRYQARQELRGAVDPNVANDEDPQLAGLVARDDVPGDSGFATEPASNAAQYGDEQSIGEALYDEGVAEATHDQMVESRRFERETEDL
jgi:hypothetical protein